MQTVKVYPCGLRLVHDYMPEREVVNVSFFVASGSGYDLPNKDGIAHFYEHIFFKSTKNRSSFQVNLDLDSLGAGASAYTGEDRTCYYSKTTNENAEKLFDILSDCFFNGLFLNEELETEKGVVCSEIDRYQDDFLDCAMNAFNKNMFKGTSFAHPILGSKEAVRSITPDDLREYREKNNCAEHIIISTAGGVPFEKIEKLVEKYVLVHFQGKRGVPKTYTEQVSNIITPSKFVFTKKETEQLYFLIGTPTFRKDNPNFVKSQLTSIMLGGTMSSRLFQRLREKEGVVYAVQSMVDSLPITGVFNSFFITNKNTAELAIKAYKKEIDEVIEKGFSTEEIKRGKMLAKINIKIVEDSVDIRAKRNASSLLDKGCVYDMEEQMQSFLDIDDQELNDYARKVLMDSNRLVSIVAKENDVDVLELLK